MEWMLDLSTFGWMLGSSEIVTFLLVTLLAITVSLWWWGLEPVPNMPPGPSGLPLVGYLPWIDSKAPHLSLSKLVGRYGKIFRIKMGGVWTVVMADPKVVKDAFNLKSTAGRAPLYLTHGIMKGYGLICAEGWLWRDHRKFVAGFMRDQGMRAAASREDMECRIQQLATDMTKELLQSGETPVDVSSKLLHHVGNTMNELIFGIKYSEEDSTWRWLRHLLEEGTKLVGVAGPMNFLPWLRFLPKYQKVISFITKNQHKTHLVYQKIVDGREMSMARHTENDTEKDNENDNENDNELGNHKEGDTTNRQHPLRKEFLVDIMDVEEYGDTKKIDKDFVPSNIIEAYIKERSKRGDDVGSFTYSQLHHVAADLFGAGSETTITTLRWHLLNMALFPQIQERVQTELDDFAGGADHVALDQSSLLPFTMASLMETQRLRSIVPLGVPHGASEALTIEGYNVPSGTMLLPLLWFIHHDPDYWNDPDEYIPERFLDEGGNLVRNHPAFMPFQAGRRMCIGDEFAKMILFVFTTRILLKFSVSLEDKDLKDDPTKDPIVGISLCPRPFNLVFTPRSEL